MHSVVDIDDLVPGMVIVKITLQNGPIKIRKSGLVTSQEMVSGLGEMGVQQVEIDPAQTVEIAPAVAQKSLTQQLLQSDKRAQHGLDSALSEQFNRSLFLPSVAQIPSLWRYYAKRFATAAIVFICGLGGGWLGATYEQWLPAIYGVGVVTAPMHSKNPDNLYPPQANQTQDQAPAPETHSALNGPTPMANTALAAQATQRAIDAPTQDDKSLDEKVIKKPQAKQAVVDEPPAPVTQTTEAAPPRISSDLLKRFEKAINDLDSEPNTGFEPRTNSASDVPRIDQLPAWVLTKLPAMAFTAHMYASNPDDRWVRVNGVRMVQGDMIDAKVRIQSIDPQHVILNYNGQTFSMSALTDW
jgi:general secretion pathway protein B